MKDKINDRKIQSIEWSPTIKDIGYDRFKQKIAGYVDNQVVDKPTDKEIRDLWKKLTGEVIIPKK